MRDLGNIFGAVAERRQFNRHTPQSVKEVQSKPVFRDHGFQVLVRRGNEPNIAPQRLVPSNPFKRPILQQPQHFGLGTRGHVADFVQEHRAAVGLFELADPAAVGSGEGSFLVAE